MIYLNSDEWKKRTDLGKLLDANTLDVAITTTSGIYNSVLI
jgi:hypothetical protein